MPDSSEIRTPGLVTRGLTTRMRELLAEEPVLVLNGPRTVGKSTLLRLVAEETGRTILDFDDEATLAAVALDPALYATAPSPVLVDEFQKLPALLDTIKAELNRDLRPGRFLLTGSTRYSALPRVAQSLTGRVHVVEVWPLAQRELDAAPGNFCQALLDGPERLVTAEPSTTDRPEYERRVLAGGLPLAVGRANPASRARWFTDYLRLVLDRDVLEIAAIRQREALPRVLRAAAARNGNVFVVKRVAEELGLDPRLVGDYVSLLESVFLLQRLPAWGRTLGGRVAAMPKMHVVDSGIAAHLLLLNERRLATRDPAVMTEFGHVLESFAVQEVIRQGGWLPEPVAFGHYRTQDQSEVDLVVEAYDGRVAAVEVKASGRFDHKDLRGLTGLRDRLGPRFVGGVVLNTGTRSFTADDRLHVMPISRLWEAEP